VTTLPTVDQRIRATLTQDAGRIPVVVGLCGSGRTSLLQRLHGEFGPEESQYVNVERTATTPERFLQALTAGSPFIEARPAPSTLSPREAFDATLAFFSGARRVDHGPVTFLLDEVLEFRTFESFPGLRRALPELLAVVASSPNRFVLTSRYVTRTERALATASPQFVVVPIGAIPDETLSQRVATTLNVAEPADGNPSAPSSASVLAGLVSRLCEGRAAYACAVVDAMAAHRDGPPDPVATMAALLETNARLCALCEFTYELRLHRARGYGALKAILEILAGQEPLTLTEISQRLGRTPGSTKDYLSWLEDVDLVSVHQKRYRFRDPLLRVWVRLHCRATPPTTEEIGREVQLHAAACLAPAGAMSGL
jgi:hypothetical protein